MACFTYWARYGKQPGLFGKNYPRHHEFEPEITNAAFFSLVMRFFEENTDRLSLERYKQGKRDFRGEDWSARNLRNADLSGANFANANFFRADLRGALLRKANFSSADMQSTNLTNANLQNANLTSASLISADLCGANLDKSIIRKTVFCMEDGEGNAIYDEKTIFPKRFDPKANGIVKYHEQDLAETKI